MSDALPLVDVGALLDGSDAAGVSAALDDACRRFGFVRVAGHGVDPRPLLALAAEFFAQPDETKSEIAMQRAGTAWRGWFPVGAELTSGIPDGKEGMYFGEELGADHPLVRSGVALHGANLFPVRPAGLRAAVLDWMTAMTSLGTALLGALAVGLGVDRDWFASNVTERPTTLFRIFHYPADFGGADDWGVREHTDYGLLTILAQDGTPGLEVHADGGWIAVPADPDVLVVNLGDMLERMTLGQYRSTPHRVRNTSSVGRLSLPFFLDPSWDATPVAIPGLTPATARGRARWDGADVLAWDGTYGDYLTAKVRRVFPALMT